MRIRVLLALLFVAILAGFMDSFAAAKEDFAASASIGDKKLSSRPAVAQAARETEEALFKKGFVDIGKIRDRHFRS